MDFSLKSLMDTGRELGLEGDTLQNFIVEQQALHRQQRAEDRAEKDRERQHERELERERQEHQLKMAEFELERARAGPVGSPRTSSEASSTDSSSLVPSFKMVPFDEKRDNIDAYLSRFERYAEWARWERDSWAMALSSLLQGTALEEYFRLNPDDSRNYDLLKRALLSRFMCTSQGYKDRFRTSKPLKDETASQYASRLRGYLNYWLQYEQCLSIEDIKEVMVMEQFLKIDNKRLVVYLNERRPDNVAEMTEMADHFLTAHKTSLTYANNQHQIKPIKTPESSSTHKREKTGDESTEKVSKPRPTCFLCGKPGHVAKNCFKRNQRPASASSAATQEPMQEKQEANTSTAVSASDRSLEVVPAKVGDHSVQGLIDSGCTTVIVKQSLVPVDSYTGVDIRCKLANGQVEICPEVIIEIETPSFSGKVFALVMEAPIYDLIVGRIQEALCGAVTRSMSKSVKKPFRSLKVPDLGIDFEEINLGSLQKSDPDLKILHKKAESGETIKYKGKRFVNYFLENDLLHRKVVTESSEITQLVIPSSLRVAIMKAAHESLLGGHQGRETTRQRIAQLFYWPKIADDVKNFVSSCDACQRTTPKGKIAKAKLGSMPLISTPFSRIAVDLVGPIEPRSSRGHRYILCLVDTATRYPEAVPLKSITTEEVAEAMVGVFSRVGVPNELQSDRGGQFTSAVMDQVKTLLSIKSCKTSPYHAMSNGLVERFNQSLKLMLKRLCIDQPKDWDRFLDPLLFAARVLAHLN